MSYAEYVKLRTLSYEGVISLDRTYIFALNYCKLKGLMFNARQLMITQIGATTAAEVRSKTLSTKMDGYMGYRITCNIPGSKAYMKVQRNLATALIFNKGAATFFITISANLHAWSDLKTYLQKMWLFRDAPNVQLQPLEDYDVSFSTLFISHKFRAIRSLLTNKSPGN